MSARRPQRWAVLTSPVRCVEPGIGPPQVAEFKTLKHKPRNVLDLRRCGMLDEEGFVRAVTDYEVRKARSPDTVRVSRLAKKALGNPTRLFGFKVTL